MKQRKNFYIFRHGICPFNILGFIQGQTHDGSLTEQGQKQALTIGQRLKDKNIEIIVSSPLKRTRQTALIANTLLNVPIWVDNRLKEVNMGVVEGMHYTVVEKEYGELYKKWRTCTLDDTDTRFEKGESKAEVRQRVFEALNYYASETNFQNIAISGHGITISQTLLSLGIQTQSIPNGTITHLIWKQGEWKFSEFI